MSHWNHGPDEHDDGNQPHIASRNARLGIWLFAVYLAFYAGFVLLGTFAPDRLAQRPWAGVNMAIWYGLGLIVAAFAVALGYSWLCRARDAS
jgi:uncharacterized membrane protein (DUF485 family)